MPAARRPQGIYLSTSQGSPTILRSRLASQIVHSRGDGLSSPCSGCCLVRWSIISLTTIHYAVNHAGFVIANIKCTIRTNRKADRAAGGVVVAEEPAGGEILGRAGDLAPGIERDEDDFVAGGDAAVPGAMEGDKEAVIATGEL